MPTSHTWDLLRWTVHARFAPLVPAMRAFHAFTDWPSHQACNDLVATPRGLRTQRGLPVRFGEVPTPPRRARWRQTPVAYDRWIFEHGLVPTRARDWHDFFNVLVWGSYPATKRALNARQYAALCARERDPSLPRGVRTREQDALAMLDEGGLLCVAHASALEQAERALAQADAEALAALERTPRVRTLLFGHAVYEHLVVGAGSVRAMTVALAVDDAVDLGGDAASLVPHADAALAARLLHDRAFCVAPPAHPGVSVHNPD